MGEAPRSSAVAVASLTVALLTAGCSSIAAAPAAAPPSSPAPPVTSSASTTEVPATVTTTAAPTTTAPTTTSTVPAVDPSVLAGISMTAVPADVIVPTSPASLDKATNPINGRRSAERRSPDDLKCASATTDACLAGALDALGFDVATGADRERRLERATAVAQLDAGLPVTGHADDALIRYLGLAADSTLEATADEARQIGTSAQGRPIMAFRYGDGPKTVLVVGQTHGDEEGGLRVLLRARSLPRPDGVTLWVIPTMNPDGLALDTRFLADGADPNRRAPSQPEQQAVVDFALAIRPSLTVWYHQNYGWVGGSGASMAPAQRYQQATGLGTLKRSGRCTNGFMWCPVDAALGSSSILVELPDVLTPAEVQTHALALLAVASYGTP
jgi:protein MpaA